MSAAIAAGMAVVLLSVGGARVLAQRVVVPLDGTWEIAESVGADDVPGEFAHTVAVPGLVNGAEPGFPDVDRYETAEILGRWARVGVVPADRATVKELGRTIQKRRFFWYRRTFTAPARRGRAVLVVGKAQFGTAVWLNGEKVGEHPGCATAGIFDVTGAIDWTGENRLVIRIGAHPGALPDWAPPGADCGRVHWAPGIYDRVWLRLADPPTIETVQVAPRIAASEILVQTRIKNHGPARECELVQRVATWKDARPVGPPVARRIELGADEERVIEQVLPVPDAVLWSPETPVLYTLETTTGGDSCRTRFGMREFRFDTATRRAMLNGKPCFLRGASFELQRFFGDPKCGNLPWDEAWVRKILVHVPREMHWNCFRATLGPPPDLWLDVADEAGILVQLEFPIWVGSGPPHRHERWSRREVVAQFGEYVRDNWNHPSVVLWDTSNETRWDFLGQGVIPAVRQLDLSDRPWENSYNPAQGPNDPYEDHPYLFSNPRFDMRSLEILTGGPAKQRGGVNQPEHAAIINEYGWLWLHRDGTPCLLSKGVYARRLGPGATPEERRALAAYLLAGLTEHWRAQRHYAGVMFYTYLALDDPRAFTCDYFSDVQRGIPEPHFAEAMREASKPLGVYIRFWQPELPAGRARRYNVMLVNDTRETARGRLELLWESDGKTVERAETPYDVPAFGRQTCHAELAAPRRGGEYELKARAFWEGKPWSPTVSRRKVSVIAIRSHGNARQRQPAQRPPLRRPTHTSLRHTLGGNAG